MNRIFDLQIEKLKTKLIKMCSLVDEQVEFAIRAVEENNNQLADLVEERDQKVDKYDLKIERDCQKIFALKQPVAVDLRIIMSALKINSNIERVGDLAVKIARQSKDLGSLPKFYNKLQFSETAEIAREMITNAIDSFIYDDPELAKKVLISDNKLDDLTRVNFKTLVDIMKESPGSVEAAIIFHSMFQELERVGDHAVNISNEVYFIVRARSIKHKRESEILDLDDEE